MRLYRFFFLSMLLAAAISGKPQTRTTVNSVFSGAADPVFDTSSFRPDDKSPIIIADIYITGNRKTKPYIIEREIPFRIGNHMMRGDLPARIELARQQLMNTALFIEVEVKVDRQVDDLVFITVQVKERWYFFPLPYFKIVGRNFNEWWVEHNRSLKRVNYGLKLIHNNISGRADKLNLYLVNGYTQQASFRYAQPAADKSLKFGFDIGFSYSRNKEISFNTDSNKQIYIKNEEKFLSEIFRTDFALIYRPKVRTKHFLRMGFTSMKVDTAVTNRNPDYFPGHATKISFPEIGYTITHQNVDFIPYPGKGVTFTGTLMKRGFTSKMNMWQLNAAATYTIPVFPKSQIYLQAAGTLKLPFRQPFYNRRLFGYGELYMRGLEYYVIDGVAGFIGRATLRREVLSFNIRPPVVIQGHDKIPFRFFLKVYGDAGYAYDKYPVNYSSLTNKLLHTYGVGLDIISFYDFVIRFEYTFNQLNEEDLFLHSRSDF
ncbi:MAG TPA: POTRA domain-containing protein [Chitinophagaceae bacterium]